MLVQIAKVVDNKQKGVEARLTHRGGQEHGNPHDQVHGSYLVGMVGEEYDDLRSRCDDSLDHTYIFVSSFWTLGMPARTVFNYLAVVISIISFF
jgi:hypothetical protein